MTPWITKEFLPLEPLQRDSKKVLSEKLGNLGGTSGKKEEKLA